MTDFRIPTPTEALERYATVLRIPYDPPLNAEELRYVRESCAKGDTIFLRCTSAGSSDSAPESK